MTFGQIIKQERMKRGWNQAEFQKHLEPEITPGYISLLENGISSPSVRVVYAMAELFSLNCDDLWREVKRAKLETISARMDKRWASLKEKM